MDFIKKLLQTNQERGRASIQVTVENDFNLPDYEPDMIKLIDRKGTARIHETRVEPDQVVINGALLFQALYKCTESGSICSLQGEVPFTETIHMEGVQETDQLVLQSSMEDLSLGMINSRKLNVRALLELHAADQMEQQIELPTGIEDSTVQTLYQQQKMLQLLTQKKTSAASTAKYCCLLTVRISAGCYGSVYSSAAWTAGYVRARSSLLVSF